VSSLLIALTLWLDRRPLRFAVIAVMCSASPNHMLAVASVILAGY
jgi:hypothetical protein